MTDMRDLPLGQRSFEWWGQQPGVWVDARGNLSFDEMHLPLLVLYAQLREGARPKAGRVWLPIEHQTAGHACNHQFITGTLLTPKPSVYEGMRQLVAEWLWSDAGAFNVSLDEVNVYRASLKRHLGEAFDCNRSYRAFEEGFYPIDCDREVVAALAEDDLPERFDDLIDWGEDRHAALRRTAGFLNRWKLVILGENCD